MEALSNLKNRLEILINMMDMGNDKGTIIPWAAFSKMAVELVKSVKPTANGVLISSIISCRDELAGKGSKVNNMVDTFCKEEKTNLC